MSSPITGIKDDDYYQCRAGGRGLHTSIRELTMKKKTHTQEESMDPSFPLLSLSMQALLTLVSGCQQTVALTFLTNELFRFNDPFCRKNKKVAEIIAKGGEAGT